MRGSLTRRASDGPAVASTTSRVHVIRVLDEEAEDAAERECPGHRRREHRDAEGVPAPREREPHDGADERRRDDDGVPPRRQPDRDERVCGAVDGRDDQVRRDQPQQDYAPVHSRPASVSRTVSVSSHRSTTCSTTSSTVGYCGDQSNASRSRSPSSASGRRAAGGGAHPRTVAPARPGPVAATAPPAGRRASGGTPRT